MAKYLGQDGVSKLISLIKSALATKQDTIELDKAPTSGSDKFVNSGAVYEALQNVSVEVDPTPTDGSQNPVSSDGVYDSIQTINSEVAKKADNSAMQTALADKATIAQFTGLQSAVDGKQPQITYDTATLTSAGWTSSDDKFTQTVNVSGVLAGETSQLLIATPNSASQNDYYDAGVIAASHAAGKVTFQADTQPESDLTVYVIMISL